MHRYWGRSVKEWWQGLDELHEGRRPTLSSREMLVFIEQLPHDSNTKCAMREGDWTEREYILAHIANTVSASRAEYANSMGGKMRVTPILSPAQRRAQDEERTLQRDVHAMFRAQMTGEFVPPVRDTAFVHEDGKGKP